MTSPRAALAARILLVAAAGVVAWTSLLPPDDLPSSFGLSDKVMHLVGYLVLGVLAVLSGLPRLWAVASVVAFGLLLELAQGVLGYRSFEWADLGADALGAVAGVVVTDRIVRELRRNADAEAQQRKRERRRERRERARHPASERAMNRERAAARRGEPSWKQVAQRQGGKCWLCGTRTYEQDRTRDTAGRERLGATYPCVDYVVAIEAGGSYDDANVRLAHRHCAAARRANPALATFGRPPRTYS